MTAEKILQSDVLDILFEGKNKLYGAYELRRTYPNRIKQSIGGMLLLIVLLTGGYLYSLGRQNSTVSVMPESDTLILQTISDPIEKPKEIPPAAKPKPPQQLATVQETTPLIQPDKFVPQTEMHTQEDIDSSIISNTNKEGLAASQGEVVQEGPPGDGKTGDAGDASAISEPVMPAGPVDMNMVDQMPEYPGGRLALVRYMITFLSSELEPGQKFVVKAHFVINQDGQVSDVSIISSDDPSLNDQVLKAIRKMKAWKPGVLHGQKVAVRFTMPVTFVGADE